MNRWPAIHHRVDLKEAKTREDKVRADLFLTELYEFFDRLQENYCRLPQGELEKCGQNGVAADFFFRVDMEKKEILLDRIYKYCSIENHLFKEFADILQHHFSGFILVVQALKGYQLAEEIYRYLGNAKIIWIHLKGREDERLLMADYLEGITFKGIIKDTESHYSKTGGLEKVQMETRSGSEISMYYNGPEGEEEVLWMHVIVPLSNS